MSQPPTADNHPSQDTGSQPLKTLTSIGQQLAGTYHPATAAQRAGHILRDALQADRLLIVLTDADAETRSVAYEYNYAKAHADDPLIRAVISEGPRVLPHAERRAVEELGATNVQPIGSWVGAPIVALGRSIGAVSAVSDTPGHFTAWHLDLLHAAGIQLGIALENARLLALFASGKREWERTVDAIDQAFCVVDRGGLILRANRAFSELAEVPVTMVSGRPWRSVLPDQWAEAVARALAFAGDDSEIELQLDARVISVSALSLAEPVGTAVLVFNDLTDTRRLQDQLIQSEKLSAIGQLIAGVAHDLNNPLASVVGFADYLVEEGDAPAKLRKPLEAIRQEAERAANIVRNLLRFARKHEGARTSQPIGPILQATLDLLKNQLMASNVETEIQIDADLPTVQVDANQIQQVFVNLFNNAAQAIKSSGEEGKLVVHTEKWLDGVAVTVENDGPEIPEHIAAHIFEPFFTTKPDIEGTGLGLSICQGIIREHGGRITYAPRSQGGATFRVELPGGGAVAAPRDDVATETGELKILVVDDEPHILHYMHATLEAWGHEVRVASDGASALERLTAEPFDVIITDLRMPKIGGREIYERLLRDHPDVAAKVVFSTGDTVRGDALQFLESAGQPFLRKPFTLAELRTVLAQAAR